MIYCKKINAMIKQIDIQKSYFYGIVSYKMTKLSTGRSAFFTLVAYGLITI